MMQRRSFLASAAALAAAGAPALVRAQSTTPLVVAPLTGPTEASMYYAIQQGWFKTAGLDLDVQPLANGSSGMSAVVGGSVQFAFGNVISLAEAHLNGIPITIVAPGAPYDTNNASIELLVAGPAPIHSAKDLAGKTIAVPSLHDLITIAVQGWLDANGTDSNSVHFIEIKPSLMAASLIAGRVDAMTIYDPFVSAAKEQGARLLGKPLDSIAPHFLVAAWFAYQPWTDTHRDVVTAFANTINRGTAYVNAHQQEILPMIAGYTHIPLETLRKMAFPPTPTTLSTAMIQPVIDAAAKYHAIRAAFPAKDLLI
ncbi:MAG: ABC transporter substrate-binding protein [Candidatus Lustribacter sp.]|jgi:NitT/TauT family transport system substrate-binding protein